MPGMHARLVSLTMASTCIAAMEREKSSFGTGKQKRFVSVRLCDLCKMLLISGFLFADFAFPEGPRGGLHRLSMAPNRNKQNCHMWVG